MQNHDSQPGAEHSAPIYYVGVGASAGGLEALESFFTPMPAESGMAFIVIQYLSPDYKSMMVELLSKRTAMPVRRAEEGMRVEANSVYLIPPKKNLSIFHGKLLLSESDHSRGLNLPIDVFLRSLADDQGEKAIGVILSGTGSDGVRGIRAIKEAGGMVMVQSEESARFDGMPRAAISTGLADFILAPDEMPPKLLSFVHHPYAAKSDRPQTLLSDEDGLTRIFALLREHTRVDFTFYKPSTVVRRIERRMTVNQIHDLRDYVKFMESYSGEVTALYRDLLIGVTSFFRDREVFDELEAHYLPQLFERVEGHEARFWVAGCSTGEEAYSLAMLSREALEHLGKRLDVKIFATDLDRDAILRASGGVYPESIAADLPPKFLTRYFHRREDHYQIDRSIREMVVFAQHNLIKDPPFTNIELVSCRNLLIYLQPVLQRKAMELINFSLNSQGLLLLGGSETTGELADLFDPLHQKFKIYASKGKRRPTSNGPEFSSVPEARAWQNRARTAGGSWLRGHEEERLLDRFLQSLAVPLAVVVNEQMEALHILGDSEGYFRLPSGKLINDITKIAVKDLAIPLATGLQKVFKTGEELKYTSIRLKWRDETKTIQIRIRPLPGKKGQEPLAAVFIEEMAPEPREPAAGAQIFDVSQEAEQRIHDLEQELQFSRETLQATIEELETSNEELQATNEELLASNEELQSTKEELQALDELPPTSPAYDNLRAIEEASLRAAELCRQMLAYSGKGQFIIETIDLGKLIGEMVSLLKASISKKAMLNLNFQEPLLALRGDPGQIRQIVMNLVINASEALGEHGGTITLATGLMECARDDLTDAWLDESLAEGLYVWLEVSDTGCGMDLETRQRIFEPFFTTKFTGRGLGLSAVLGIVRGHRGALKVHSEPGVGTIFKVLFPAVEQGQAGAARSDAKKPAGRQHAGTILLVDDEESVRTMGRRMLERNGFQVLTAADGRKALEIYGARHSEIALVLLDLTMPDLDGEETFHELRQIDPNVRVILSSGYTESEIIPRFAGQGLTGFLQKPYTTAALMDCLRGSLGGGDRPGES